MDVVPRWDARAVWGVVQNVPVYVHVFHRTMSFFFLFVHPPRIFFAFPRCDSLALAWRYVQVTTSRLNIASPHSRTFSYLVHHPLSSQSSSCCLNKQTDPRKRKAKRSAAVPFNSFPISSLHASQPCPHGPTPPSCPVFLVKVPPLPEDAQFPPRSLSQSLLPDSFLFHLFVLPTFLLASLFR